MQPDGTGPQPPDRPAHVAPWVHTVRKRPEQAAQLIEETGDFRVLRRFSLARHLADPGDGTPSLAPIQYVAPIAGGKLFRGAFVDVETTGFDTETDEVISIAVVPFEYDERGLLLRVLPDESHAALRNPCRPIPLEVQILTGITDELVMNQGIEGRFLEGAIFGGHADDPQDNAHRGYNRQPLIIAHHAAFDRKFVERLDEAILHEHRQPTTVGKLFASLGWACSRNEVDWKQLFPETSGTSVDGVLAGARRMYVDAEDRHTAAGDAFAMLHALATPLPGETARQPFTELLESAQRDTTRLEVYETPVAIEDRIKQAGFLGDLWQARHIWYKDFEASPDTAPLVKAEGDWIEAAGGKTRVNVFDAYARYSGRV